MGLIATKPEGGDFEQAPEGNHIARCYMVCDLGEHEQTYLGESKGMKRKVRLAFELCNETMSDGRPFSVAKKYTLSLNEKAALRKDLESWRGRSFTVEEEAGFDLFNVIGKPCMVSVVHDHADNGNTYVKINAITAIPKGLEAPPLINEPLGFSLDDFDQTVYDSFPDWLKNLINVKGVGQAPAKESENPAPADFDDDIPF